MELVIGLGMLLFCAWNGFQASTVDGFDFTMRWYAQTIISGLGGLYIIIPKIQNVLSSLNIRGTSLPDHTTINDHIDSDKYRKDFECLVYLRDRCIENGSKEGLDFVVQLNTILFKKTLP